MSIEQPDTPRCRYCREDAWCILQGWRFGPPNTPGADAKPDAQVPVCLVHRSTGVLRLTSLGFPHPTEVEVGTIYPGR